MLTHLPACRNSATCPGKNAPSVAGGSAQLALARAARAPHPSPGPGARFSRNPWSRPRQYSPSRSCRNAGTKLAPPRSIPLIAESSASAGTVLARPSPRLDPAKPVAILDHHAMVLFQRLVSQCARTDPGTLPTGSPLLTSGAAPVRPASLCLPCVLATACMSLAEPSPRMSWAR